MSLYPSEPVVAQGTIIDDNLYLSYYYYSWHLLMILFFIFPLFKHALNNTEIICNVNDVSLFSLRLK